MATYYVSPTGSGLHDGSSPADSWTLDEFVTAEPGLVDGDKVYVTGSHSRASSMSVTKRIEIIGYGAVIDDKIKASIFCSAASSFGGYFVDASTSSSGNNRGLDFVLRNLTIDANSKAALVDARHCSAASDCDFRNGTVVINGSVANSQFLNANYQVTFGGSLFNCFLDNSHAYLNAGSIHNCVFRTKAVTGFNGVANISDSVFLDVDIISNSNATVTFKNTYFFRDTPRSVASLIGMQAVYWDGSVHVSGCTSTNYTNMMSGNTYGEPESIASVFADADPGASLDLRLNSFGKSRPDIQRIMANLDGVPGVTIDSLDDLFGGSAAPQQRVYSPHLVSQH